MVVRALALHQHIIYVDFHGPSDERGKYFVYKSLVRRSGVLKTERHDLVTIEYLVRSERGFGLVNSAQWNLVVSRVSVHEAQ